MSLNSEDFNIDLLRDIFRTHPMWNYNYYFIIESDDIAEDPIGIGFKIIKIFNKNTNEYESIDKEKIQIKLLEGKCSTSIICESGMTHDGQIHKFVDKVNAGKIGRCNVLVMEIEKSEGEYEDRLNNGKNTIKTVRKAWILEGTSPLNIETTGFDAMSNEIFIQKIEFNVDDIKAMELSKEIALEKAKTAVSKLY